MQASIKYIGEIESNYTRYGKFIPKSETDIDMCDFFSCDIEKAKFIAGQLISDKNVKLVIHKTAGVEANKRKEVIEIKAKNTKGRAKLTKKDK
jgi:hypothetical protein